MYIELHASSAFSFLDGASLPEALVDRAAELGYSALALLDRDGVYGAPRFHKAALAAGIKPIVGCELTIAKGWCHPTPRPAVSGRSPIPDPLILSGANRVRVEGRFPVSGVCRCWSSRRRGIGTCAGC